MLSAAPAGASSLVLHLDDLDHLHGNGAGTQLGRSMAVGDLDCDGERDDLVVGSVDPAALWIWLDLLDPDTGWPGPEQPSRRGIETADVRIVGADPSFGATLAIGALGGACDAIAAGAPDELLGSGVVRIFQGPIAGGCAGPCELSAGVHEDVVIVGVEQGRLGASLAIAGSVDGRGHDDLFLGEPAWQSRGRVLLYGQGLGAIGDPVVSVLDADLQIVGLVGDAVGTGLQAADLDDDGVDEILIGDASDVLLVHDLSDLVHDPLGPPLPPPVASWGSLIADPFVHHGHVELASLPVAVHGADEPLRALWVGTPSWFLGIGAVVALRPDSQGRWDQSTAQAAVRIEGDILVDANFGRRVHGADVTGDGVRDLIVSSPFWSDGEGTVVDSVGSRAGRMFVFDGADLPALLDAVCAPAPCGYVGDSVARIELRGSQAWEGWPSSPGAAFLGAHPLAVAGRLLVAAPLRDDDVGGLDAGAVLGLTLDQDRDGALVGADCEDFDATVGPGAAPLCDGVDDQDCDGVVDVQERDADLDGLSPCDGDCDDADPLRSPARLEAWCDGRDNDCVIDTLDVPETDGDGDGAAPCEGDCDDGDPSRHPDAAEACNGRDDDCDGAIDEDFDADGDGYPDVAWAECADRPAGTLDCDDADPTRHPGAAEGAAIDDADCDGAVEWRGGCACDASDRSPPAGLAALALLCLGWGRRRRPGLASLLLLAPLVMGQAQVIQADDRDLLVVGTAGSRTPAAMTIAAEPSGDDALVLSAPYATVGLIANHGWGYVVRPSTALPRLLTHDDRLIFGQSTNLFQPGPRAGWALASGDLDGDGRGDVVIGAPGSRELINQGRIWTWRGAGPSGCPGGEAPTHGLCAGKGFLPEGSQAVGFTVSVADLDGDGFDDIVASDPTNWTAPAWTFDFQHYGSVWIFWGQADGSPGAASAASQLVGTEARAVGTFVRAEADWTCDGAPDLVVGCDSTITGGCGPDELLVLLGSPGERAWTSGLLLDQPRVTVTGLRTSWDMVVAQVPDVGGDGCDDVLLGLPAADDGAGLVAFVPITPGQPWTAPGSTAQAAEIVAWSLAGSPQSRAGVALELVRWTRPEDAVPDILVGMPGAASALGPSHRPGRVAFLRADDLFGPGPPSPGASVEGLAAVVFEGRQQDEQLGARLGSWADRDGDGARDVLVGATGLDHPDGGLQAGGVYLLGSTPFRDADGDGVPGLDDCDDGRAACVDAATDCQDADGDGVMVCAGDCDDADPAVHPPRTPRELATERERCNGRDDDCDGALAPDERDEDGDGVLACGGDCDDTRAEVGPGFVERCDGLDGDCDGAVDEDFDADSDGWPAGPSCQGIAVDCDDRARAIHPGALELPGNGLDDDCVGGDASHWPGGCACAGSTNAEPGPLELGPLLLLLGAAWGRRGRRRSVPCRPCAATSSSRPCSRTGS